MNAENTKSWITSKTIAIAARIPHHIHALIEDYGKKHFPNSKGYDKTATILDLLRRGLEMGDDGVVLQNAKQTVNQEVVQQLVKQAVEQGDDRLGKLESAITLVHERLDRLEREGVKPQGTSPLLGSEETPETPEPPSNPLIEEVEVEVEVEVEGDQGVSDRELTEILATLGRKTTVSTVGRWRNGKTSPTGQNKDIFEFWEVRGDRWYQKA